MRSAGYCPYGPLDPDIVDVDLAKVCDESKKFKLYGKLFGDILNSDILLINGVSVKIVLNRSKDTFALMGSAARVATNSVTALAATEPKLKISDASIFVRKVKLATGILRAHAKALQRSTAKYPIKRTICKLFNLATGQAGFSIDNVFLGQLPSLLILCLVEHEAHLGNYNLNPLAFKNHDLNFLCVYLNGESFPAKAYMPDYANNNYEREYFELHNQLGLNKGIGILDHSYKNFKDITNLYCFNFNPDLSYDNDNYINISKEGELRVEVRFQNSLTKALKLICYAQFDNTIEIDNDRNITTDF